MSVRKTGRVRNYNSTKNFGFLRPDDGGADSLLHVSELERSGIVGVSDGDILSYTEEEGPKGFKARSVRLEGRGAVQYGSGGYDE